MPPRALRPRPLLRAAISFALLASACDDAGIGGGSGDVNQMPGSTPARTVKNPPRKAVSKEQFDRAVEFVNALNPPVKEVTSVLGAYAQALAPAAQGKSFDAKATDQAYAAALARLEKLVKDVEAVPDFPDKLGADYKAATLAFVNGWAARFKTQYAEMKRIDTDPGLRPQEKYAKTQPISDAGAKEENKQVDALNEARRKFTEKYRYVKR